MEWLGSDVTGALGGLRIVDVAVAETPGGSPPKRLRVSVPIGKEWLSGLCAIKLSAVRNRRCRVRLLNSALEGVMWSLLLLGNSEGGRGRQPILATRRKKLRLVSGTGKLEREDYESDEYKCRFHGSVRMTPNENKIKLQAERGAVAARGGSAGSSYRDARSLLAASHG